MKKTNKRLMATQQNFEQANLQIHERNDEEPKVTEEVAVKNQKSREWFWKICCIGAIVAFIISIALWANNYESLTHQSNQPSSFMVEQSNQIDVEQLESSILKIMTGIAGPSEYDPGYVHAVVGNIQKEQLKTWIESYGELYVKEQLAYFLLYADDIELGRYIEDEALVFNLKAGEEYKVNQDNAVKDYFLETGKDPYEEIKNFVNYNCGLSSSEVKKLIEESQNTRLLEWYRHMIQIQESFITQANDTEKAISHQLIAKNIIMASNCQYILDIQLKMAEEGSLTVVDNKLSYTEQYSEFIRLNWMYILAY